jgi:epimerase transport system membrane fusion protein
MDIDRVTVGQEATISFSAFSSGLVPTIYGKVIGISADRLIDQATGAPYYLARVEVTPEGMMDMGDLVLVSGMPAEVFINTGTRTFLQYIFKPFTTALSRSFIED